MSIFSTIESGRQAGKTYIQALEAKRASQRRMLDYLLEQDLPSWEHDFVHSLNARLLSGLPLSEKQDAKLIEVFERS